MTLIHTIGDFADNSKRLLCADPQARVGAHISVDFGNPAWATALTALTGATVLPNLAPDEAMAANLAGVAAAKAAARSLVPLDGTKLPTWATPGLDFFPATKSPMQIKQAGVADRLVLDPKTEGFKDFLSIIWFRPSSTAGNMVPWYAGTTTANDQTAGVVFVGGNLYVAYRGATPQIPMAIAANALVQLAVHYHYDVPGDASTFRIYRDGALVSGPSAGSAPSAHNVPSASIKALIGGGGGYANLSGKVYRFYREFTGISGRDPAAIVAADYAANLARFS